MKFSGKERVKSFRYALKGILFFYRITHNAWIQSLIAVIALVLGFVFHIPSFEWLVLILTIAMVIGFEMLNTAIEELVNMVSPDWNEKAGRVKDLAAGAVLLVSLASAIVGAVIFIPYFIEWLK